ncbi:MAG: tRNA (cytidine(34)-2'-O)-methyltransferase [Deltaproteobacteria bacterium]|nr:tRNA (cytidine(34)-2'-O)-methyltransferase [Deltaproteobacteria bacterium]MBW1949220.1 tRNA (cytidine(34)-2'-O)-methyltransferase [Deltaproteobacteria bacterium]MBW2007195.1 tRNA (cytidine(34)-2'-O)-methyltransferase [Deltaproteobacteria bacterium]MBW2346536.1 tRNA (cytidine(34)-2'-O)-methyltransferase [Deltaproteobacteria bacterium]
MGSDVTLQGRGKISDPWLHVVLYEPEIPANTGNIARLCGAARLVLHLIHPLGFRLDDRHLKRAGLDYWPQVDVRPHENLKALMDSIPRGHRIFAFSRHCGEPYTRARPRRGDYLIFGPETRGLPPRLRSAYPCYRIPIWGNVRSLNLSTAVGIVTYHFLHHMGRF